MKWWEGAAAIGGTLLIWPLLENRKVLKESGLSGLPRQDAPGQFPIAEPTHRRDPETIAVGFVADGAKELRASGPCCDKPDWINAGLASDEDRIPCQVCKKGIMQTSEHMVH
jgi:hypothetical protein